MEADSTTSDNNSNPIDIGQLFPFHVQPGNLQFYLDIVNKEGPGKKPNKLIQSLQEKGLIPTNLACPKGEPECKLRCINARVVDRVQWACQSCSIRLPIRFGTFFFRVQCSIQQILQIILSWTEDADCETVAEYYGIKLKLVNSIFERLDNIIIEDQQKTQLGGENSVVLAEMYPGCLNRLSPDTTDQPHVHNILMLADTNHVPTRYVLHVMKENSRFNNVTVDNEKLTKEVSHVVSETVLPETSLVVGNYVPLIEGAATLQHLTQHCDTDMQRFLCERIWRQATCLCAASRDLCVRSGPSGAGVCARVVQRYLDGALYRAKFGDNLYNHVLTLIADRYSHG